MDFKIKHMGLRSSRCRFSQQILNIITTMLMAKITRLKVVLHQESKNSAKMEELAKDQWFPIRLKHQSWFLVTWKTQAILICTSMLRHNKDRRRSRKGLSMLVLWDQLHKRVVILSIPMSFNQMMVVLNQLGSDTEMAWTLSHSRATRPL